MGNEQTKWFYLSFAEEAGFLGGCYVEGKNMEEAVESATKLGINPGGQIYGLGPVDEEVLVKGSVTKDQRNKLLSGDFMIREHGGKRVGNNLKKEWM